MSGDVFTRRVADAVEAAGATSGEAGPIVARMVSELRERGAVAVEYGAATSAARWFRREFSDYALERWAGQELLFVRENH